MNIREVFMKWWQIALIVSVFWVVLCAGGGVLFFPSGLTPEQDSKLSEIVGEGLGVGLVFIWAIVYARWKFKNE